MAQEKVIVWTKNLHTSSDPLKPEFFLTVLSSFIHSFYFIRL